MKTLDDLVAQATECVTELMPWDLEEKLAADANPLIIDVREPSEFEAMHIPNSLNVPRGILESACEFGYDDTEPVLANARDQEIIVVCRSGKRSCLAAFTMQQLGYQKVLSLKTGLRGWNDYDQPMLDNHNQEVDADNAEEFLRSKPRADQLKAS